MSKLLVCGRIECGRLMELRGMQGVVTADVYRALSEALEEEEKIT